MHSAGDIWSPVCTVTPLLGCKSAMQVDSKPLRVVLGSRSAAITRTHLAPPHIHHMTLNAHGRQLLTCLDDVTCGASSVGHDGPVGAAPAVEDAALANIGAPHNGHLPCIKLRPVSQQAAASTALQRLAHVAALWK